MHDAALLVEVTREPFVESRHLGHAVVARPDGQIVEAWGDPARISLPRSSAKMLQALPLLESGAGDHLSSEQLALACASHSGEARHVERVSAWLADLGLEESALRCGPEESRDRATREEMIREGRPYTRVFNNCSGKHAGFLTLAGHLGASLDYVDPGHPVQIAVRAAFEEMCGEESPGFGIDGCSAPNFAASLAGMARAMARFAACGRGGSARDQACLRLREAMIAHPELVSGRGRVSAALMRAAGGRAIVKSGAEGFFVAILPGRELGVAIKIEDGAGRAAEVAVAALLARLGALDPADPVAAACLRPPVLNREGLLVGEIRPAPGLLG